MCGISVVPDAEVELLVVAEVLEVAVRADGVRLGEQRLAEPFDVRRLQHVVVEVEEEELGLDTVEQYVRVAGPAESLRLLDDLDARVLTGMFTADLRGAVVAL